MLKVMSKLASHNSMTFLPVKHWWLRPFAFIAKCQSKHIFDQYLLGARCFDIRLKYNKDGSSEFAHGLISYKGKTFQHLDNFHEFIDEPVYLRIILETNESNIFQEICFSNHCKHLESVYPKFKCCGGYRKFDWYKVYNFKHDEPSIDQKVSSMTWKKLDDWFPYLYARLMNKKNISKGTDKDFLMIDFIDIQ